MPTVADSVSDLADGVAGMLASRDFDAVSSLRRPRIKRENIVAGGVFVVPVSLGLTDESRTTYRNDVAVDIAVFAPVPADADDDAEQLIIRSVIDDAEVIAKAVRENPPIRGGDPATPMSHTFVRSEISLLNDEMLEANGIAMSTVRAVYRFPRGYAVGV